MAKWRGTATVVCYFDAPDKSAAGFLVEDCLTGLEYSGSGYAGYRDLDVEEIDEELFRKEAPDE